MDDHPRYLVVKVHNDGRDGVIDYETDNREHAISQMIVNKKDYPFNNYAVYEVIADV